MFYFCSFCTRKRNKNFNRYYETNQSDFLVHCLLSYPIKLCKAGVKFFPNGNLINEDCLNNIKSTTYHNNLYSRIK